MNIAISGASGYIGTSLINEISKRHNVIKVHRADFNKTSLVEKIKDADCLVNLAGESISKFFIRDYKTKILNSRINTTKALLEAAKEAGNRKLYFINASAIGIYNSTTLHDESSTAYDSGFYGNVISNWENILLSDDFIEKKAICRFGIVLGKNSGFIKPLFTWYKMGLAPNIAGGYHYFPFIHNKDVTSILTILIDKQHAGIFNIVAPECIRYKDFHNEFMKTIGKRNFFNIPAWMIKIVLGYKSSILLDGQKVVPQRLLDLGYTYEYSNIEVALQEICQ